MKCYIKIVRFVAKLKMMTENKLITYIPKQIVLVERSTFEVDKRRCELYECAKLLLT